jgi:hypothetical protein
MAVTDWNSEGMVWTAANLHNAPLQWQYFEALRQAINERVEAVKPGIYSFFSGAIMANPITPDTPPPYLFAADLDFVLRSLLTQFCDSTYDNYSIESMIAEIGDTEFLYASKTTEASIFAPRAHYLYADWMIQKYKILNKMIWVRRQDIFANGKDYRSASSVAGWPASAWTFVGGSQSGGRVQAAAVASLPSYLGGHAPGLIRQRKPQTVSGLSETLFFDYLVLGEVKTIDQYNSPKVFDDQGSGFIQDQENELINLTGKTGPSFNYNLIDDNAAPPTALPPGVGSIGWEANGPYKHIRKYDVTNGFSFL